MSQAVRNSGGLPSAAGRRLSLGRLGQHVDPLGRPEGGRGRMEWLWWLLTGAAVAVALTWPLVRSLSSTVPQDLGDPLAQAWTLSWGGHALLTSPGRLFQGNVFWPSPNSYAYTDTLLGYAPAAFLGQGPVAAVVRYNIVLLLAYALALVGAALPARELGCRPAAAAVAGLAYAWAPWRVTHNGHLNVREGWSDANRCGGVIRSRATPARRAPAAPP